MDSMLYGVQGVMGWLTWQAALRRVDPAVKGARWHLRQCATGAGSKHKQSARGLQGGAGSRGSGAPQGSFRANSLDRSCACDLRSSSERSDHAGGHAGERASMPPLAAA